MRPQGRAPHNASQKNYGIGGFVQRAVSSLCSRPQAGIRPLVSKFWKPAFFCAPVQTENAPKSRRGRPMCRPGRNHRCALRPKPNGPARRPVPTRDGKFPGLIGRTPRNRVGDGLCAVPEGTIDVHCARNPTDRHTGRSLRRSGKFSKPCIS